MRDTEWWWGSDDWLARGYNAHEEEGSFLITISYFQECRVGEKVSPSTRIVKVSFRQVKDKRLGGAEKRMKELKRTSPAVQYTKQQGFRRSGW